MNIIFLFFFCQTPAPVPIPNVKVYTYREAYDLKQPFIWILGSDEWTMNYAKVWTGKHNVRLAFSEPGNIPLNDGIYRIWFEKDKAMMEEVPDLGKLSPQLFRTSIPVKKPRTERTERTPNRVEEKRKRYPPRRLEAPVTIPGTGLRVGGIKSGIPSVVKTPPGPPKPVVR